MRRAGLRLVHNPPSRAIACHPPVIDGGIRWTKERQHFTQVDVIRSLPQHLPHHGPPPHSPFPPPPPSLPPALPPPPPYIVRIIHVVGSHKDHGSPCVLGAPVVNVFLRGPWDARAKEREGKRG
jgi:hypothetical protein